MGFETRQCEALSIGDRVSAETSLQMQGGATINAGTAGHANCVIGDRALINRETDEKGLVVHADSRKVCIMEQFNVHDLDKDKEESSLFSSVHAQQSCELPEGECGQHPYAFRRHTSEPARSPFANRSHIRRPSETAPAAPDAASEAQALKFTIMLDKRRGDPLGAKLDTEHFPPLVAQVHAVGLLQKWNEAHSDRVQPGDLIIDVNGARTDLSAMVNELRKDKVLMLEVQRAGKDEDDKAPHGKMEKSGTCSDEVQRVVRPSNVCLKESLISRMRRRKSC
jgi:hypothetical protein